MAVIVKDLYPGQVDESDPTGYPSGRAQNIDAPFDGIGFPLEKQWVNDLLGWQQALLDAAGLTPSGNPDKVGASQYLTAIQSLIDDGDDAIIAEVPGLAANYPIFTPLVPMHNADDRFTFQTTGNIWRQTDVTDAGRLIFPVQLPRSGTVTLVTCYVKNAAGRAGLPATMPLFNLKQTSLATGTESNVSGGITDTSANLAAYETAHSWSSGVLSHVISGSATYSIEFTGEAGANAAVDKLELIALVVTVSP